MNVEQNRLDTFEEWPQDAAVTPPRIAKAGFFYTKHDVTVECFSCHLTISEWNYGDQVMAKHKTLNPSCPFVLNPTTSGNVPIISPTNVPSTSDSMKDEAIRLKTFAKWPKPHIVAPERLARAGFYYLNTGDNTKCAFCKGVVRAWELGDDPDQEHKRHFEDCPFVLTEIVPRLNQNTNGQAKTDSSFTNLHLVANENLHCLGVQTHKGPKKPNYATLESRLRSFATWPPDLIQTPDILSQAGFYYEGMGDQVRCFHCDGGLRHWDPQDDPWTEHARWFPRCSFIKLVKGQDFVTACSLELNVNSNLEEVDQKNYSSVQPRKREVTEQEIQEHMLGEVALSALSIGLNVERVKRAIREKLEQTGRGYSQPDALVEAALNLQHSEEDSSDDQDTHVKNVVENVLDNIIARSCSSEIKTENESIVKESKSNKTLSLEEENRILKEARLCKICMDAEVGIVFLPCGHLTTCVNCAPNLEDCPLCRSAIKATVRTFLS
ncbi:baculoviral IAP repeat-containing protein 7-A-like [Tribolium madens]|uniref:baculoviral IAP repeat-containing protein 7-A-like n=1 Tax=Tribolium madens TaxID=41895 RepID=UPI001CF71E43|nr:baculoviral IAP repeat-containing protein 7-A-like [Tribolium madens]